MAMIQFLNEQQFSKSNGKKATTMAAASPTHDSRQLKPKSTVWEKSKVNLKPRSRIWENKRRLVKQRLMSLIDNDENVESVAVQTPILSLPPKESLANDTVMSGSVMERAEAVQANLSQRFPSFLKPMLKSHVSGGFWLGLPKNFCLAHLPDQDEMVVLVDEYGEEYITKFLADKTGLSGGWRGFSIAHKLLDEDVLVFQLIEPCKFKIYIVRARSHTEIGVTSRLDQNSPPDEGVLITESTKEEYPELFHAEKDEEEGMEALKFLCEAAAGQSEDDSNHCSSEVMEDIRFSDSVLSFKDVKSFNSFHIHIDGLMIDAEIPSHLRKKYYELCCSQKAFLHENLAQGLNVKLAAGMICETINIADAIRAAKPSTATRHLQNWDRSLKAFEDLGMMVGFLRDRINKLLNLYNDVQAKIDLKSNERNEAKEEKRSLKIKLLDVETRIRNLDKEIDVLVVKKGRVQLHI